MTQVATLILMLAIGGVLRKKAVLTTPVVKGLTDILMDVTLPCLILYSFNFKFSEQLLAGAQRIFIYSCMVHGALIVLSPVWYYKFKPPVKNIFYFSTVFSNCGFLGYPLVQALFGSMGVFYTSIFLIPFNLLIFTYGVMLFTGEMRVKTMARDLISLPLIATVLGILVFAFSLQMPAVLLNTLGSVGNMTTPLSMFIIGAMLADVRIKDVFKGADIYYLSFLKLIAIPLACYGILHFFIADKTILQIIVIMTAMPTASLVGVFAEKYDSGRLTASRCTFITTMLSVLTIPVILWAIQ